MWINKKDYESLTKRIENLESQVTKLHMSVSMLETHSKKEPRVPVPGEIVVDKPNQFEIKNPKEAYSPEHEFHPDEDYKP